MGAVAQPFCERIVDRYAIYDQIAVGGMAVVHLGRLLGPAGFSRTVAIKRLHPQFASNPDFVTMFLDEARLAVRVQHPNVVAPLDVLVVEDELLVVMDYVSGETLSALMRGMPPESGAPPAIVGSILVDALYGLHAAHEAKAESGAPLDIVHRDISPQNIIVGVDGVARVLDFGVAKAAVRSQVTKDGEIKGKISYMAPEQLKAHAIDRRTDVFAAGIVLWEALTGRRLFRGDDLGQTVERVLYGEIPSPSSFGQGVTKALDAVVLRALQRDPSWRFATARDFAIALEGATTIASASEVADWVRTIGGANLEQKIQRVAAIESHSSSRVKVSGRDSGYERWGHRSSRRSATIARSCSLRTPHPKRAKRSAHSPARPAMPSTRAESPRRRAPLEPRSGSWRGPPFWLRSRPSPRSLGREGSRRTEEYPQQRLPLLLLSPSLQQRCRRLLHGPSQRPHASQARRWRRSRTQRIRRASAR